MKKRKTLKEIKGGIPKIPFRVEDIVKKSIIDRIEKYSGKVFGLEIVISDDLENKDYIKGFEDGKKYMKEQIIEIITDNHDRQTTL